MLRRILLGAALAAGVVPFSLVSPAARAAEIDPVLPKETEQVVYVNVRQVVDSELVKKFALGQIKQTMEGNEDVQKFLKDFGIDPFKDIDRVTIGSWGGKGDDDEGQVVGVIRGRFDAEKIFAAVKKEAAANSDRISIVTEGDYKLVKVTQEKQPKPIYAAVADENTVVAGNDKKSVAAAVGAAKNKTKAIVKKDLARLLLKQDEKASMYAVGLIDGKDLPIPPTLPIPNLDPAKLRKHADSLKNVAVTVKLTADVDLEVTAGMADADSAGDFADTVKQLVGQVKAFLPIVAGPKPNLKSLVDDVTKTLKATAADDVVTVVLKLTADALGKAAEGE